MSVRRRFWRVKQRVLASWEVRKGSEAMKEGKEDEALREVRLSNSNRGLLAKKFFWGGVKYWRAKYFSKSFS